MPIPQLGIIEGFYGKPWTWDEREQNVSYLGKRGYGFYIYAPKADPYLRRRWQEEYPSHLAERLAHLAAHCKSAGVRFGVGITPFETYDLDEAARTAFGRKLNFFAKIGVNDLAVLFDDMRGDVPNLARRQVAIVEWVRGNSDAERMIVCPSYYSDDPILDRVFGARPTNYVEELGAQLAPDVEIFWTGEEVISRQYSPGHLERVGKQLQRKPMLWDNYPVNDGHRMSQYLHLRGFTGRPSSIAEHIAAHAINPTVQPTLARVPALTLVESYREGDEYSYGDAFRRAAIEVMGEELGTLVREDLLTLQDIGLDRLGEKEKLLRERYAGVDHPAAREIIAWLDGAYRITDEIVQTQ
ncbi:MAG TPA: beta-N-acetylglucosaminidase domain-containing protein [Gemmatimonadaceae bacterium]|nr:beta-N-acetylglucosaminidase domain-containing protein [Gemmatimonadaceae bacterium]